VLIYSSNVSPNIYIVLTYNPNIIIQTIFFKKTDMKDNEGK